MIQYRFGSFTLIPAKRSLLKNAEDIILRGKDFDVLLYLIRSAPETCTHDDIIASVWGGTAVENNSVEKSIAGIRRALGDNVRQPLYIKTVRGQGYLFIGDVQRSDEKRRSGSGTESPQPLRTRPNVSIAPLAVAVIIIGLAGFLWWKGVDPSLYREVLFADYFSGGSIDENLWTVTGRDVTVKNGVASVRADETDNWGRLESTYFRFDPEKPLSIKSRLRVAYSRNLKDKTYFHGYFGFTRRSVAEPRGDGNRDLFGVYYANYDYESKYPDGNTDEQKAEGFFLVKNGGVPHKRIDYESGRVGARIPPVWDVWFDQEIIYDAMSGLMRYFIDGDLQQEFNVGPYINDLDTHELRLEISPEGWWLYHIIDIDSIEITQ